MSRNRLGLRTEDRFNEQILISFRGLIARLAALVVNIPSPVPYLRQLGRLQGSDALYVAPSQIHKYPSRVDPERVLMYPAVLSVYLCFRNATRAKQGYYRDQQASDSARDPSSLFSPSLHKPSTRSLHHPTSAHNPLAARNPQSPSMWVLSWQRC